MKHEGDDKLQRLFATVRDIKHDVSRTEHNFEVRLRARLGSEKEKQVRLQVQIFEWAWRLMPVFIAVVIVFGAWRFSSDRAYYVDYHLLATISYERTIEKTIISSFMPGV